MPLICRTLADFRVAYWCQPLLWWASPDRYRRHKRYAYYCHTPSSSGFSYRCLPPSPRLYCQLTDCDTLVAPDFSHYFAEFHVHDAPYAINTPFATTFMMLLRHYLLTWIRHYAITHYAMINITTCHATLPLRHYWYYMLTPYSRLRLRQLTDIIAFHYHYIVDIPLHMSSHMPLIDYAITPLRHSHCFFWYISLLSFHYLLSYHA